MFTFSSSQNYYSRIFPFHFTDWLLVKYIYISCGFPVRPKIPINSKKCERNWPIKFSSGFPSFGGRVGMASIDRVIRKIDIIFARYTELGGGRGRNGGKENFSILKVIRFLAKKNCLLSWVFKKV